MDENPYKSPVTSGARRGTSLWLLATAALYWLVVGSLILVTVVAGVAVLMAVVFTIAKNLK